MVVWVGGCMSDFESVLDVVATDLDAARCGMRDQR